MTTHTTITPTTDRTKAVVTGQRFAYATAALILGVLSFVHLLGLEKALLAIGFGVLALRSSPAPPLAVRRGWAWLGVGLAIAYCVVLAVALVLFWERLVHVIYALEGLQ
jgi:hypothetical protein